MYYIRSTQREETREPLNLFINMEESKCKKKVILLYNT